MKKSVASLLLASALCVAGSPVLAQSAVFTYTGVPSGPVLPGSSVTVSLFVNFVSGGNVGNLAGLSYWLWQSAGTGFPLTLTNRDVTGSLFTDLQSMLSYPQILDPINRNPNGTTNQTDLGAFISMTLPPLPSGPYFVANLTFSVSPNAVPGMYTLGNTASSTPGVAGRVSLIIDSDGDTFPIAVSNFNIAVVPEPSSNALMVVGAVGAGLAIYGRRPHPRLTMRWSERRTALRSHLR